MQLIETLSQYVTPQHIEQIAGQLGASPEQTQTAVKAAIPALVTGLSRKADKEEGGAQALVGMLDADGDGSVLDDLGGLLGGGAGQSSGAGGLLGAALSTLGGGSGGQLLGQLLGGREQAVEAGVAKASGLDGTQVSQLLAVLAPMVLGALGKMKQREGLDAGGVADKLREERQSIERESGLQGALEQMLDRDDDGSIADDIAELAGKNLLGGLFGR